MRWIGLVAVIVCILAAGWVFAGYPVPVAGSASTVLLVGGQNKDGPDFALSDTPGDSDRTLSDYGNKGHGGFHYSQEIQNPGSRSAGLRGFLTYKGFGLRGYDGRQIRTPIGSFHFIESPRLWESQGWFPMADIPVTVSEVVIDQPALNSGSYKGELRIGTPEDWCYDPGADTWYKPELLVFKPSTSKWKTLLSSQSSFGKEPFKP